MMKLSHVLLAATALALTAGQAGAIEQESRAWRASTGGAWCPMGLTRVLPHREPTFCSVVDAARRGEAPAKMWAARLTS